MKPENGILHTTVSLNVAFQDADPAGVVWHGNYFRYFDAARCALLERLDYGYRQMAESGLVWPVVDTRVRFLQTVAYDERIEATAFLVDWEFRLKIGYVLEGADGSQRTNGYTIQAAVDMQSGELQVGVPAHVRQRIEKLVADA